MVYIRICVFRGSQVVAITWTTTELVEGWHETVIRSSPHVEDNEVLVVQFVLPSITLTDRASIIRGNTHKGYFQFVYSGNKITIGWNMMLVYETSKQFYNDSNDVLHFTSIDTLKSYMRNYPNDKLYNTWSKMVKTHTRHLITNMYGRCTQHVHATSTFCHDQFGNLVKALSE